MMIAALLFSCIAIYMIVGWAFIAALDRRMARGRNAAELWVAILFWPITIIVDLVKHGPNK